MRIILKIIASSFVLALMLIVAVPSSPARRWCGWRCTVFVLRAVCAFFAGLTGPNISPRWLWRSLFPPLGLPRRFGRWIVCMRAKYALQDFMGGADDLWTLLVQKGGRLEKSQPPDFRLWGGR